MGSIVCQVTWKWQLAMTQDDVQRGINKKLEQEDSHVWKSPKMSHLDSIFCPLIEFGSKFKFLRFLRNFEVKIWIFCAKIQIIQICYFHKSFVFSGKIQIENLASFHQNWILDKNWVIFGFVKEFACQYFRILFKEKKLSSQKMVTNPFLMDFFPRKFIWKLTTKPIINFFFFFF